MADQSKKKKKTTKAETQALDEETLNKLVNQKLKEFGVASEDDKEVKKISNNFMEYYETLS